MATRMTCTIIFIFSSVTWQSIYKKSKLISINSYRIQNFLGWACWTSKNGLLFGIWTSKRESKKYIGTNQSNWRVVMRPLRRRSLTNMQSMSPAVRRLAHKEPHTWPQCKVCQRYWGDLHTGNLAVGHNAKYPNDSEEAYTQATPH